MLPPFRLSEFPLLIDSLPPSVEDDRPPETKMSPPFPFSMELPVVNDKRPVEPLDVVPVENLSSPLTPDVPAFDVLRMTFPAEDTELGPLDMKKLPPVLDTEFPTKSDIEPPLLVLLLLTDISIFPLIPPDDVPVVKCICPDAPLLEDPDEKCRYPLLPLLPAFEDSITTLPLLDLILSPEDILMVPPVFDSVIPAMSNIPDP